MQTNQSEKQTIMNVFADGKGLRKERERRGLSLADLARMSGVSKGTIGNYETGARPIGRKSRLAIASALTDENMPKADTSNADIMSRLATIETLLLRLLSEKPLRGVVPAYGVDYVAEAGEFDRKAK